MKVKKVKGTSKNVPFLLVGAFITPWFSATQPPCLIRHL